MLIARIIIFVRFLVVLTDVSLVRLITGLLGASVLFLLFVIFASRFVTGAALRSFFPGIRTRTVASRLISFHFIIRTVHCLIHAINGNLFRLFAFGIGQIRPLQMSRLHPWECLHYPGSHNLSRSERLLIHDRVSRSEPFVLLLKLRLDQFHLETLWFHFLPHHCFPPFLVFHRRIFSHFFHQFQVFLLIFSFLIFVVVTRVLMHRIVKHKHFKPFYRTTFPTKT